MSLKVNQMLEVSRVIKDGFPKAVINKWVTHKEYEEITLEDENGMWEISFYPREESE